ncbi:putative cupin superfamily protein [Luteibacter sp. Sphag1AF]|uniref:cupin domain-containing protein n=1 Tax=Luteibacter sp. Sphag1AF TaxID=2587031 RepID=UPI00161DBD3B|nr:cupin domain-containing protein [Luteibacter sp. Sphag1AF]MBB3228843.1 putative cupin superfamily protein [Luteibacter sp. Sphag1AF]
MPDKPDAIKAVDAPPRTKPSNYPEPFASLMAGRVKRPLGDMFGITNFGVNLSVLPPGSVSALHHQHTKQDEFIYVLEGHPTLITDAGERVLEPGMVAGFAAGGTPHHLENRTQTDCVILEVGDRSAGDEVSYPADDLQAVMGADGKWVFARKDGRGY